MKIYVANSWCKVEAGTDEVLRLRHLLSYIDKNQTFQQFRYTQQFSPVRKSFLIRGQYFPTGLLELVLRHFPQAQCFDNRSKIEVDWQPIPAKIERYGSGHQAEALRAMMSHPRGTIQGITAMGKTYVEAGFTAIFEKNILILTMRREIFDNIVSICREVTGEEIGQINSRLFQPQRVTVAMVGTLHSRINESKKFLQDVHAVLVDESHHCSAGSQLFKVIQKCESAYYRYGFTATPFRESGDSIAVFATTGPIIYTYPYAEAVKDKVVVPIEVYLIKINRSTQTVYSAPFNLTYNQGIVQNDYRNLWVLQITKNLLHQGENVLILVWKIEHGKRLSKLLRDADISHEFIHGSSANRLDAKERFEKGELPVLIASGIYDEGVNIERIQNIIKAAGFKSERLLVQRTGRGMRPFKGKNKCRIFDFYDSFNDILLRHSRNRLKYYGKMGFQVKILDDVNV